jgi:hypothetical protein
MLTTGLAAALTASPRSSCYTVFDGGPFGFSKWNLLKQSQQIRLAL